MSYETTGTKQATSIRPINSESENEHKNRPDQRPRLQRPRMNRLPAVMYEQRGDAAMTTTTEHRLRIQRLSGPLMNDEARKKRRERVNARIRDLLYDRINGEHRMTQQIEE